MPGRWKLGGLALIGALAVSACDPISVPVDGMGVGPAVPPAIAPAPDAPSPASARLSAYYRDVENGLVARGLLRSDGGGPDAPFDAQDLTENFVRIALFEEFVTVGGRVVPRQTESQVHRWDVPVRFQLEFGPTVPLEQQETDRRAIGSFVARLAALTGQNMRLVRTDPNFLVFIVNEEERRVLGPELQDFMPGISDAAIARVVDLPKEDFCVVFASDPGDRGSYSKAVAIIRAEHPNLLRRSCIHEEIAQGLGLLNDSPKARPSIFNDDEEYGLLTTHDEMLLRILYDPRIKAGMTADEARNVAGVVAAELMTPPQPQNEIRR